MSFLTLGGDGALRPTYFELVAADRLLGGLKSAISYSLGVSTAFGVSVCQAWLLLIQHCCR